MDFSFGLSLIGYPNIAIDPSNDILVVGTDRGGSVYKLAGATGDVVWSQFFESYAAPKVVAADSEGAVYVTGYLNVGGGTHVPRIFLKKYDKDGNFRWSGFNVNYCPDPLDLQCGVQFVDNVPISLSFDPEDNVIVAGVFGPTTVDFGVGGFNAYALKDFFVVSYTGKDELPAGERRLRWAKQVPIVLGGTLFGVDVDRSGRVVTTGMFSGSIQVDDHLLVTKIPESEARSEAFIGSFGLPPADTTPPVLDHVPLPIVTQATTLAGAKVFFMPPTATDEANSGTNVLCSPPPNTTFIVGTTDVTCTASDPAGNHSSATFTVTVVDPGPVFSPVDALTFDATSASGAIVTYPKPTALDQIDGASDVTCTPASGSALPIGTTTVTCTAADKHQHQSQTTFPVTVKRTGTDLCASVTCVASGPCHVAGVCDPSSGLCSDPPAPDGTSCDDGNACTTGDTCGGGKCGGTVPPPSLGAGTDQTVVGTCNSTPLAYAQPQVAGSSCQTGVTISCTPVPGNKYGANTVICTATNGAGTVSAPVSFRVTVLQPLTMRIQAPLAGDNASVDNVVKAGSTVPVKVLLFACGADVTTTAAVDGKLAVNYKTSGGSNTTATVTATSSGAGDANGVMIFDGTHYRYNLSTKGYSATQGVPAFYQVNLSVAYKSAPGVVVGTDAIQLDVK
jgi:hypothetical protein